MSLVKSRKTAESSFFSLLPDKNPSTILSDLCCESARNSKNKRFPKKGLFREKRE